MRRGLLIAAAALAAAACGYRFTAGGGELPGGARSLYVPVFQNATVEPGLEGVFTDALRDELARWGREGGEAADARVEGRITAVGDGSPIRLSLLTDAGLPIASGASYRVSATVVLRVWRGGEKLAETAVSGSEDYLPERPELRLQRPGIGVGEEAGILEVEANRRAALRRLARTLMQQAYQNLTAF